MTLGEKLQELRRRSGMSQDTLAEKLDVSRQAVSKWERDEAIPETDKIVRISQVFGVTTDYLLTDQQPQTPPEAPRAQGRSYSWDQRLDRLVRRHGYKAGYALIAWGTVLCVIALLVMIFFPLIVGGFLDTDLPSLDSGNPGIQVEGDIPQDVLDDLLGSNSGIGNDPFTDMEDLYDQQVQQMQNQFLGGVRIMCAIFGVPVLLLGIGLIVAGVIVLRKGKQLAENT